MAVRGPDTRIPLMGVPVEMPDILGTMGRVAQIKRLEAISQQEQQEMALKQQALEEDAQVKQIFAEPGMTWEKAMPRLQQISPARALVVQKMLDEQAGTSLLNENRRLTNTKLTKSQQDDEAVRDIAVQYGGLSSPEAIAAVTKVDPVRAIELQKLQREAQGSLQRFEGKVGEEPTESSLSYDPVTGQEFRGGRDGENVTGKVRTPPKAESQRTGEALALSAFAAERGKTVEQLSRAELIQAHKEWAQSDDRPRISVNMPGGLTPTAEAAIVQRLQTQWTKATASNNAIKRQISIMDSGLAAGRRGDLPQANEAVLQTFLKILDPDSVVREGEFQRLREGASMVTRAETMLQRLTAGGFLPMSELEKYAALAKEIQAQTKDVIEPVRARIGKTADRYKVPRDLVMDEGGSVAPTTPAPVKKANPFRK